MKATTLTQRISKTNNANRSTPKNSDYEMAIYILQAGKAYVSYGGSKYGAAKSRTPERYLIAWGIDFKSGNDAPRGGKAGDFIELTKKGNTQVKDYRLMLMNQKIEAEKAKEVKAQRDLSLLEGKKNQIVKNIQDEKEFFANGIKALSEIKDDKAKWQILANSLVQKACKNDFTYGWPNILRLIKNN